MRGKSLLMLPVMLMLLLCTGCKEVTPEVLALMKTAAFSAKESASAFNLIAPTLKSKSGTEADQADLARYCKEHSAGLFSLAKGLDDLVKAAEAKPNLSDATKTHLAEAAKAVRLMVTIFQRKSEIIFVNSTDTYVADHHKALDQLASTLEQISAKVNPPKKPK